MKKVDNYAKSLSFSSCSVRSEPFFCWTFSLFFSHFHRYVITELLQSDLHKIIVSPQHLSADHIKVFLYQILRGLKYLHSARILHRDIKPGNLLVNSNCVLKICDFGLARVEEPDQTKHMTQEVVTQYYRAPEILMGARHYSAAVDVWSVGCIFGELLGRRILFQAQSPVQQVKIDFTFLKIRICLFTRTSFKFTLNNSRVLKISFICVMNLSCGFAYERCHARMKNDSHLTRSPFFQSAVGTDN